MKLDQERQVGPSDVYDDMLPSGSVLESGSTDIRYDLNALRTQVRKLIDLASGTPGHKWFDEPGFSGGAVIEMFDNSVEVVVVGDPATDKVVDIEYSYQLPISGRQRSGCISVMHNGTTAEMVEEYDTMLPEITGVSFSVAIVGSEIRLSITNSSVGENPKMVYRRLSHQVLV